MYTLKKVNEYEDLFWKTKERPEKEWIFIFV